VPAACLLRERGLHALLSGFGPLTLALNDLNLSMGLNDPYPFVLCPAAVEKLRFVHGMVETAGGAAGARLADGVRADG